MTLTHLGGTTVGDLFATADKPRYQEVLQDGEYACNHNLVGAVIADADEWLEVRPQYRKTWTAVQLADDFLARV